MTGYIYSTRGGPWVGALSRGFLAGIMACQGLTYQRPYFFDFNFTFYQDLLQQENEPFDRMKYQLITVSDCQSASGIGDCFLGDNFFLDRGCFTAAWIRVCYPNSFNTNSGFGNIFVYSKI